MSTEYEFPLTFFGVDSAFIAQERPVSPALLRPMARNSNRLATQTGPLLHLVWDAQAVTEMTRGAYSVVPTKDWQPMFPELPCPKNPIDRIASLYIWARITNGVRVYVQVTTSRWRFEKTPPVERVLTMNGDGTLQRYSMTAVQLGTSDFEPVGLYFKTDENAETADTSGPLNVTDATGTVTAAGWHWFEDSASGQTTPLSFPFFQCFVKFTDANGTQLWNALRVDRFEADQSGTGSRFQFTHDYNEQFSIGRRDANGNIITVPADRLERFNAMILGATYEIVKPTAFQVASVMLG